MKLYLTSLALALTLLLFFLADTTITWRPFSISFGRGWLGVSLVYYQGRWNGLKRGAEIKKEAL